jgi:hypothetical protein
MTVSKILRCIAALVISVAALLGAAVAWFFVTEPQPRQAEGWTLREPLPWPRGELATAVAHIAPCPDAPCPELERLFVMGGLSGIGTVEDGVTVYDPGERRWSMAPPLPAPRHHLAAAGLGQAIYVSGGAGESTPPWSAQPNFWKLAVGDDRWQELEPMPEPRYGHRMVPHEDSLYVIGGSGSSSRILVYSPETGWRTGAEMPRSRHHISAVAAEGRIWAMGGRSGGSLDRVDVYDIADDSWLPWPNLPTPASGAAEGIVNGTALIFGGEEARLFRGEVYDRHWMVDVMATTPAWQPAPPPPLPVHGADGAIFQGTMVIAGGAARHGALSVTAWTDAVQWLDPAAINAEPQSTPQ